MRFFKKRSYIPIQKTEQVQLEQDFEEAPSFPDGKWIQCTGCKKTIYQEDIGEFKVCPHCNYHFRINARDRIQLTMDHATPLFEDLERKQPITFPKYDEKIHATQSKTNLDEAVKVVVGEIGGEQCVVAIMDSNFLMGSMGQIVGEKLTLTFEYAIEQSLPVVVFTASGGARMQEGILSLMQMAKISSVIEEHSKKGLFYLTVLTDPTTGGVTASFAMLGDVIISEPKATIGFAGKRVIEQTTKQSLPDDFQMAEKVLEQGFIDHIFPRQDLKVAITQLLRYHRRTENEVTI